MNPALYLYIDHTHLSPWANASLLKNREILEASGITLAPPLPGNIPRWSEYWHSGAKEPGNPRFQELLEHIHAALKNGGSVLLPGAYFDFEVSRQFLERIKTEFAGQCAIRAAVFFEKPALMLEWWHRRVPISLQKTLLDGYVFNASHASPLFKIIEERLGKDNVSYFFNGEAGLDQALIRATLGKLFDFLKIGSEPAVSEPLPHVDWLAGGEARQLTEFFEIGHNVWPSIDSARLFHCARQWEEGKPWRASLPWEARRRFLAREERDRESLGAITGIAPERLAPPDAFIQPVEPKLDVADAEDFFSLLPEDIQGILFSKLNGDSTALNDSQLELLKRLKASGSFSTLETGDQEPLLTVLTLAYNHEKYVAECMDSVLAQKTAFPVRHIVLDNYSTDSTAMVVSEYAARHPSIQPVLLKGDGIHYNGLRELFSRGRSKYVSICEGDDYFTDPLKLQRQVDYLEANKDCALAAHPVLVHFDDASGEDFIYPPASLVAPDKERKYGLEQLFKGNFIQTNSVVYRWRFSDGLPDWFDATLCPGDWYWHLLHAEIGRIGFLPGIMSVYRRHSNALYKHAFKDVVMHRKHAGMGELRTYDVVDRHFKGAWHKRLTELAAGVFADFLRVYVEENDPELLNEACNKYPRFAKDFLARVNISNAGGNALRE